jgi:membrane-associated protein
MKYYSTLPLTALAAFSLMNLLVYWQIIPPGLQLLTQIQGSLEDYFYLLIMLIIMLESIVYVGFYFPGQFFAVVMVIGAQPSFSDVVYLTMAMVIAATIGSTINYFLGRLNSDKYDEPGPTKLKHLLLAMIHMNSLAFFMFSQGANHKPFRIVMLAGLINMPYYLALIAATAFLSEEVMQIAENTALLFTLLGIWLVVAIGLDIKRRVQQNSATSDAGTDAQSSA